MIQRICGESRTARRSIGDAFGASRGGRPVIYSDQATGSPGLHGLG